MAKKQGSSEIKTDSDLIEEVLEQANELEEELVDIQETEEIEEVEQAKADEAKEEEVTETVAEPEELLEEDSVEDLQKQLNQAENKANENWDKALRIQAEMENLKRRTQKDLENAHKYGLEKFAKELLSVIDSLELGLQAATSDAPEVVAMKQGSELTIKQFEAVFAKFNIEALDPTGEAFNPELHQAMTMQPSADVKPNTVLNVFQKGYILNGRLIRPAMVVVSQAVPSKVQADDPDKPEGETINLDERA